MQIEGAIFDCDGTLVDSMGMWFSIMPELLARHGFYNQEEILDELEPLGIEEECHVLHNRLGVAESGAALYAELQEFIREEYAHNIHLFDGCREFLESLHEARIPMVVASSTAVSEIDLCLRANGVRDYFSHIINTGEVGRSKEFPDVYYHAQELLGTPTETTWVFEDAPFGVRTSHKAGFPNVCIFNKPDGRNPETLKPHCTIFSEGYSNVSLEKLQAL